MNTDLQQRSALQIRWETTDTPDHLLALLLRRDPRLDEHIAAVQRRFGELAVDAPLIGEAPLFAGHRLYHGAANDWLLVSAADDPLALHPEGMPVPLSTLRRLRRLRRHGPRFDAVYLAHDVAPGALRAGERLTEELLAPPPSAGALAAAARIGRIGMGMLRTAAAPAALLGAARRLAVAPEATAGRDPLLIGAIVAPEQRPEPGAWAAWFLLAQWGYNLSEG